MLVLSLMLAASGMATPVAPAAPAPPTMAPTQQGAPTPARQPKKICKREQGDSSSKVAGKKICLTAAEWKSRQT